MATLIEIKRRIQGVRNTQKITKAMKVVATTRLKKNEARLVKAKAFLGDLEKTFAQVLEGADRFDHPLTTTNSKASLTGVVVMASDRGLCGSFNSLLFRQARQFLRDAFGQKQVGLFLVGLKAEQHFKKTKRTVLYQKSRLQEEDVGGVMSALVDDALARYQKGEMGELYLLFNGYRSRSDFGFTKIQLLPFDYKPFLKEAVLEKGSSFLTEPSLESCLDSLIPLYLKTALKNAFFQSQTAEELSRMLAMDYATENANELIGSLTLEYNRRRQEVITKEISEIVGGAEALKK